MTGQDFRRIVAKFQMETRTTDHVHAFFWYNGQRVVKTKCSHGSGELPASHKIRQQLKLSEDQLRGAIDCSFSLDDYIAVLREKRIIGPGSPPPASTS